MKVCFICSAETLENSEKCIVCGCDFMIWI